MSGLKVCAYFGDVEEPKLQPTLTKDARLKMSVDFCVSAKLWQERRLKRRGWGNEDAFHVCVVSRLGCWQQAQVGHMSEWLQVSKSARTEVQRGIAGCSDVVPCSQLQPVHCRRTPRLRWFGKAGPLWEAPSSPGGGSVGTTSSWTRLSISSAPEGMMGRG